ncbi:metallo-beta-lactamase domain-containing protein 1 [Arapaima gigas]
MDLAAALRPGPPDPELREIGPDIPGEPYSVSVLQQGYNVPQSDGSTCADCTVSLLRGPSTVLVDTGGPWGSERLLQRLRERGVEPGDVHVVVGTHGHSDHIGNLSLFPGATIIVGCDVSRGDRYLESGLAEGRPFCIDSHVGFILSILHFRHFLLLQTHRMTYFNSKWEATESKCKNVSVVATPGHTGRDVSVLVRGTSMGTVIVAGDLFECCHDEDTWRELSENPAVQETSRKEALRMADVIVPGHGAPFQVHRQLGAGS